VSPVMAILQDHLLVPSRTICSACSRLSMCVSGSTENVVLKRRQCPRHQIALRQPLVTLATSALGEESRPLEAYVLRRPPKDASSRRIISVIISMIVQQQQQRARVQQASYGSD